MLVTTISEFFVRDLNRAADEIEKYESDDLLWSKTEGIPNSGGNLGLHLAGNINHFLGAILGKTGYIRERELEFSSSGLTRAEVADSLRKTAQVAKDALAGLTDEDLASTYPEEFAGEEVTTGWIVTQMLTHLNYHLGQINYHRRMSS